MNRFLLFLLITFVLISGGIIATANMDEAYVYEDNYPFFNTYDDDADTYYTDGWDDDFESYDEEEGTYTDTFIEEDEAAEYESNYETYNSYSDDEEEVYENEVSTDVGYDDSYWDEKGPVFPHNAYNFMLINAPEFEYDILSDFTLSLYQSDFLEEIEMGNIPGIAYTLGQEMRNEYYVSHYIPYLETIDAGTYYWLDDSSFAISVNENEGLTLAGFIVPVSTTLDELIEAYGEPIVYDNESSFTYTYLTHEHYRLIFHADPYDKESIRFMEYY